MKMYQKFGSGFGLASLSGLVSGVVNAAALPAIDVTDATATLTNQTPSITEIALAVLMITFVVVAFKMVKRAAS